MKMTYLIAFLVFIISIFISMPSGICIDVELSTDKEVYYHEPVKITISVTNNGIADEIITFPDSQIADFKIINETGDVVFLWSYAYCFLDVVTTRTIPAEETVDFWSYTWDNKDNNDSFIPIGNYTIIAWLPRASWAYENPDIYTNSVNISIQGSGISPFNITLDSYTVKSSDKFSVHVTDIFGQGIEGVEVFINNVDNSSVITNETGYAILTAPSSNQEYVIFAKKEGYISGTKIFEVQPEVQTHSDTPDKFDSYITPIIIVILIFIAFIIFLKRRRI